MTQDVFEVQAALLYEDAPNLDVDGFKDRFDTSARDQGFHGPFETVPISEGTGSFAFSGHGVCVTVMFHTQSLDKEAFALALRAPILKHKEFDFAAAIDNHEAAIVITVADPRKPMSAKTRQELSDNGEVEVEDAVSKLTLLHLVLQEVAAMTSPLMIDFCPSQSLLTTQELAAVSHMGLPVPLLFHPFPIRNAPAKDGRARKGMAAIHAPRLVGTELELEAIPNDVPLHNSLHMLASLMSQKLDGSIELKHGESVLLKSAPSDHEVSNDTLDDHRLWIRHEDGATETSPTRVVASFDTRAPLPETTVPTGGHQAFQDRIARLKTRGPEPNADSQSSFSSETALYSESAEELRERVQDAIGTSAVSATSTRGGARFGISKVLALVGVVGCFFLVAQVTGGISELTESDNGSGSLIAQILLSPSPSTAND